MIRKIPYQAMFGMLCVLASFSMGNAALPQPKKKVGTEVWWSLKQVVRPAVPDGPESNPIDRFIQAEIRNRGLTAVGAADKLSLLRRVYLDLIGIPPSPAEQEAFLADDSPDAYEKVVDRLLADESATSIPSIPRTTNGPENSSMRSDSVTIRRP